MSKLDVRSSDLIDALRRSSEENPTEVFPKQLKPVPIVDPMDENGLTSLEKATLRNAWRFVAPFKCRFGKEVFYDFLTSHETQIETFRYGKKISLQALHGHAQQIMNITGHLVLKCLDQPMEFRSTLEENMPAHTRHNINSSMVNALASKLKAYLVESKVLKNSYSPTLEDGLYKLLTLIGTYNNAEESRKEFATKKYSLIHFHQVEEETPESEKPKESSIKKSKISKIIAK